jgi:acetylornithine/succinyldiaminopimelate/putrescine aminotransferase
MTIERSSVKVKSGVELLSIEDAQNLSIEQIWDLYGKYVNAPQVKVFRAFSYGNDLYSHSDGMYLYTKDGRQILDFTGGLGVLSHGHNHPRVLAARIRFQQEKRMEVHKLVFSPYIAALSHNIAQLLPGDLNVCYFPNSGAEANEGAIKAAHKFHKGKRRHILFANISYHGKLIGTGTISGLIQHQWNFPRMEHARAFEYNNIESVERLVRELRTPDGASDVYALIVEPFVASSMTEGDPAFLRQLRAICDRERIVLIFDEVYSGWAKTGTLFYFMRHEGLIPDALSMSKSLGGGKSSISAYVLRTGLFEGAYGTDNDALLHSTTYNGFGEECVTAMEAIQVMVDEDFPRKAREISDYLKPRLEALKRKYPKTIGEIRGVGAFMGVAFKSPYEFIEEMIAKLPLQVIRDKTEFINKVSAAAVTEELYREHRILTTITPTRHGMIMVAPSLVAEEKHLDYFVRSLDAALDKGIGSLINRFLVSNLKNRIWG